MYGFEAWRGGGPLHAVGKRFYHAFTFRDASLRTRPLLWFAALNMWSEKPIWGLGHGRFAPRFLETVYETAQHSEVERIQQVTRHMNTIRADYTHNDYLQYLAEWGFVGYALLILIGLSLLIRAIWLLFIEQLTKRSKILLGGSIAIVAQTAFQCLYDFPLHLPASAIFFALGVGGIIHFIREASPDSKLLTLPSITRWGVVICIVALFLIGFEMIPRHFAASHLRKAGRTFAPEAAMLTRNPQKELGNLRLAEENFARASQLYPGDGEILFESGRTYYLFYASNFGIDYRKRAVDYLERAKETFCIPELYHILGMIYIEEKRYTLAQRQSKVLLLIDPMRDETQYLAGLVDYYLGEYEEAVDHFHAELANNPEHLHSRWYIGMIYQKQFNQYEAAAQVYQQLLDINKNMPDAHESLGDIYFRQLNRPLKAREHYQQALELAVRLNDANRKARLRSKLNELQRLLDLRLRDDT